MMSANRNASSTWTAPPNSDVAAVGDVATSACLETYQHLTTVRATTTFGRRRRPDYGPTWARRCRGLACALLAAYHHHPCRVKAKGRVAFAVDRVDTMVDDAANEAFGAVHASSPDATLSDHGRSGRRFFGRVIRTVVACTLVSFVASCSKGASMSSAPASTEHPPTNTARSSSSERTAAHPSDEKTVVSRLDSMPPVAPLPLSPNGPGPGATPTPAELELQKEADAKPAWPPPGMKLGANPTVKNFEAFWKPFRAALLVSDTDALAKVTRFPLRALSDSDPERSVDRGEFPRLVRRLLAQGIGLDVGGHESHLQLVNWISSDLI